MKYRNFLIMRCFLAFLYLPAGAQENTVKNYHPNGKLREVMHHGLFNGCDIPVGTDSLFTPAGTLLGTKNYTHFSTGEGCHSTLTVIEIKTYFPNGKPKVISYQRISYEGEAWRCGIWKWYNTAGKVVRKKDCGKCILP